MPDITPGQYSAFWIKTKKDFQTLTKVKKPAETILFWRKGTGLEPALKKLDSLVPTAWKTEADYAKFSAAFAAVDKAYLPYRTALEQTIVNAKAGKGVPKGVTKDIYVKAVQTLQNELSGLNGAILGYSQNAGSAANTVKNLKLVVDNGLKFVATVEKNPTPKAFNDGISNAARRINQQIGNIDKLKSKGMDIGLTQPTNLHKVISAWGDAGRRVEPNATTAEVQREIDAFKQAVLGVQKWFKL